MGKFCSWIGRIRRGKKEEEEEKRLFVCCFGCKVVAASLSWSVEASPLSHDTIFTCFALQKGLLFSN